MTKYQVIERRKHTGQERVVYRGEVALDILAGRATLQPRAFGKCYRVDGTVLASDDDWWIVRGVTCRFEPITP